MHGRPAKMFRAGTLRPRFHRRPADHPIADPRPAGIRRPARLDIALQVKEVGSGASQRQLREKLLEAARRREIDVVLVWRLDRWGRSVADLLATLQELDHLGVGFVSLTEALDLTTPAGRAMAGLLAVFAEFEREILRERVRAGLAHARQNGKRLGRPITAGAPRRPSTKAVSRRRQQGRNRPPAANRPHLGAPDSGVTLFPGEIGLPLSYAALPKGHGSPLGIRFKNEAAQELHNSRSEGRPAEPIRRYCQLSPENAQILRAREVGPEIFGVSIFGNLVVVPVCY